MNRNKYLIGLVFLLIVAFHSFGQDNKRFIKEEDYGRWETLSGKVTFSPDGKYISYQLQNKEDVSISLITGEKQKMQVANQVSIGNKAKESKSRRLLIEEGARDQFILDSIGLDRLKGLPKDKVIDFSTPIDISADGLVLSFTLKDKERPTRLQKPNAKPEAFIWHWKDDAIEERIQADLKNQMLRREISKWICNKRARIGFEVHALNSYDFMPSPSGNFLLLRDGNKYLPAFKEDVVDVYLINTLNGEKNLIAERVVFAKGLDPLSIIEFNKDESKLVYFKDCNWWSYNMSTKTHINLTKSIATAFWNTEIDMPGIKLPFGLAGWNDADEEVLLYDEFNIYAVKIDGNGFRKLTKGEIDKVTFRLANVNRSASDKSIRSIQLSKPLLLWVKSKSTGYSGYYELNKGKLKQIVYDNTAFSKNVTKAEKAETYAFTKQGFDQSPSLWVWNGQNRKLKLIAETNPQQNNYYWGRSEMIRYQSKTGEELQGALFYPANYQPDKKYPMVVHIYERLSAGINRYAEPNKDSAYNLFNFTQQGYFVFQPDIIYQINDPGISAVNCVVPAVEAVLKKGMVDRNKIGLMGHSWGAYETTFIISKTNLFKAAVAGAPPTDMISFSLGFRWDSGSTNQLFEGGQARFSGPFYEQQEAYIRNSSVYQSKSIHTPLLIGFGDKDGYVDWHQGIELYNALRRQQKPCILLHYKGSGHRLPKDYRDKQMEYFGHYLKGMPAPEWMNWEETIKKAKR